MSAFYFATKGGETCKQQAVSSNHAAAESNEASLCQHNSLAVSSFYAATESRPAASLTLRISSGSSLGIGFNSSAPFLSSSNVSCIS